MTNMLSPDYYQTGKKQDLPPKAKEPLLEDEEMAKKKKSSSSNSSSRSSSNNSNHLPDRIAASFDIFAVDNDHVKEFIGELVGTMILMIYGNGVLAQVILGREKHGNFLSISLGWGFAVYLGVFYAGKSGKGQINPAITLVMALTGKIAWIKVPIYILAQYIGAFIGSLLVLLVYYQQLSLHDEPLTSAGNSTCYQQAFCMQHSGNIFVTRPTDGTSLFGAVVAEIFGTFLLASGAYAIVDPDNFNVPDANHPIFLGLLVATIVGGFALNTGAALNPARDFGPRCMMSMFGYGAAAFQHADYYFWVPVLGPCIGALLGGVLYEILIGRTLRYKASVVANSPDNVKKLT